MLVAWKEEGVVGRIGKWSSRQAEGEFPGMLVSNGMRLTHLVEFLNLT
ncbi:MAG TPA: hypothetical protein VFS24_16015 [Steroidobacteraceae bacterium]|nr:hypothetical protein [Steroidobacteraceae bacterium]